MATALPRVLLVEPDELVRLELRAAMTPFAGVDSSDGFEAARESLQRHTFDLLVTALRLRAFNGLHLVYLSHRGADPPHAIVYTSDLDTAVARDVRAAGAFYEIGARLRVAVDGYLTSALPHCDRRCAAGADRRHTGRGGRRRADLPLTRH
jgi:DNA-binding NarL/FixJ family response regulator